MRGEQKPKKNLNRCAQTVANFDTEVRVELKQICLALQTKD